jgi:hypothetical protein
MPKTCAARNRVEALTCRLVDRSCSLVFVDEAAEDRSSLDPPASKVDKWRGYLRIFVWRSLPPDADETAVEALTKAYGARKPRPG